MKQMIARHIARSLAFAFPALFALGAAQASTIIGLEPDDYPDTTVLDHIIPQVSLYTLLDDNRPVFSVTANTDGFGYASTGQKVFGHANVPFWIDYRRLRMTFDGVTDMLSIDAIGGTYGKTDTGRLEVYGVDGSLLDVYMTRPLGPGSKETMTIHRARPDIAYAIAYTPANQGTFLRLDNLHVDAPVPVPEPGSVALLMALIGAALLINWRRCR